MKWALVGADSGNFEGNRFHAQDSNMGERENGGGSMAYQTESGGGKRLANAVTS